MTPLNVLVVDDSLLAVRVLKSALEELGHKVVKTAGTGAAASPPRIGLQTSLGPTDHRVAWRIVGVSARRSKESQSCRCGS